MERIIKQINLFYYLIYTATILVTIIGYILTMSSFEPILMNSPLGISLKSIAIIYMMISIPLALGGFFQQSKKWILISDENQKFNAYKKGAILRLLLVGFGLIINIVCFFVIRTDVSLIYCAGISAIILLFFCKPTVAKMISDLKLDETQD